MFDAAAPIRSVCPMAVMTSKLVPFKSAANLSSACLPAGLTVALPNSNSESAENVTFLGAGGGAGGGGGGGGAATGGGGGGGEATMGAATAARGAGAGDAAPKR